MEFFKLSLATLTGGSGAVGRAPHRWLVRRPARHGCSAASAQTAPQFHGLCRWGIEDARPLAHQRQFMSTDSVGRAQARRRAGRADLERVPRASSAGAATRSTRSSATRSAPPHRDTILKSLGIAAGKDFSTYPYLGNIGTVSLPMTAALAEDRELPPRRATASAFLRHRQRAELPDARRGVVNATLYPLHRPTTSTATACASTTSTRARASRSSWSTATRRGRSTTATWSTALCASTTASIVPDHIGCGLSDKPDDERYDYTLESRVDDLEALLDHLGLDGGPDARRCTTGAA